MRKMRWIPMTASLQHKKRGNMREDLNSHHKRRHLHLTQSCFRSKQMQIINEEAAQEEEEEEGETGSCNDDSSEVSDEDDVENLLAPQEQTQIK